VKQIKLGYYLLIVLLLCACGRSKPTVFYVLNPISVHKTVNGSDYSHIKIGINKIGTPGYIQKPQLNVFYSKYRLMLEENNNWAEDINTNIQRVLRTNLSALIPGAIVENSPWISPFQPDYQLQLMITQYKVNSEGVSILRAEYIVFHNEQIIKKRQIYYRTVIHPLNPENLVISMNQNLERLSRDVASFFKQHRYTK